MNNNNNNNNNNHNKVAKEDFVRKLWDSSDLILLAGAWGSVVVKALRYNSEGPGIDSRCRRGFFRGV
jgi:hypothetical protein